MTSTADFCLTQWAEDDGLFQHITDNNPLLLADMSSMSLDAECADVLSFLELLDSSELADAATHLPQDSAHQLKASAPPSSSSDNVLHNGGQELGTANSQVEGSNPFSRKVAAPAMEDQVISVDANMHAVGERNTYKNVERESTPRRELTHNASKDCEDDGMSSETLIFNRPSPHKRRKLNLFSSTIKKPTSTYVDDHTNAHEDDKKRSKKSSKNLNSERDRRKMLNANLYALRSLVPKITKMDKASIVSDTIGHVQSLQKQIKNVNEQIQALRLWESSVNKNIASRLHTLTSSMKQIEHKILQVDVTNVEKAIYQLKIVCSNGQGVIANLTKAVEMLGIDIVSAHLITINDNVLNTIFVEMRNGVELEPQELRDMVLRVALKFGLGLAKDKILDSPLKEIFS